MSRQPLHESPIRTYLVAWRPKRSSVMAMPIVVLVALLSDVAAGQSAETFSGSGVVVGANGEILTTAHAVEGCRRISVNFASGKSQMGVLIAHDEENDLAVVRARPAASVAVFQEGGPLRVGDTIVTLGYPRSGRLAAEASVSVGKVIALAPLVADSRYVQINAPVLPGNSGGPLLNASGHLVGVVADKRAAIRATRFTEEIPQNVNFALKAEVVQTFLDGKGIAYKVGSSDQQLLPTDFLGDTARPFTDSNQQLLPAKVVDIAWPFTVHIQCEQAGSRSAAAPSVADPPGIDPTPEQFNQCIFYQNSLNEIVQWCFLGGDPGGGCPVSPSKPCGDQGGNGQSRQ